jgi:carbamoyltransferase
MYNLGFHGSHNSTISISFEDKVLECIEIERLISHKNAALFYYENPLHNVNIIKNVIDYFYNKYKVTYYDKCIINSVDTSNINLKSIINYGSLHYVPHHEAHSCSAFYQSSYDEALVISYDGGSDEGFFNVYLMKRGCDPIKIYSGIKDYAISYMSLAHFIKDIKKEKDIYVGNLVYAGKLMGYAGFGNVDEKYIESFKSFYYSNTYDNVVDAVDRFVSLFSKYGIDSWDSRIDGKLAKDLAATNQYVFQELFLDETKNILEKYPDLPLILTGGCALNILNNTSLSYNREVFVPPNPSDVGISVGLLCSFIRPKNPIDCTYIGPEVWDKNQLSKHIFERNPTEIIHYEDIVDDIIDSGIIGIVQGRCEHGPRALGNRSIICDATNPDMKNILNYKIKNREGYRPFSPVVRLEDINKYFEFEKESRWMSFCPRVKEKYIKLLQSVTHVDGTARVQTVTHDQNPLLYNLLTTMYNKTGHAVLLNTSFNIAGKPILNTYEEALWMFDNKNMSGLILENFYFKKSNQVLE